MAKKISKQELVVAARKAERSVRVCERAAERALRDDDYEFSALRSKDARMTATFAKHLRRGDLKNARVSARRMDSLVRDDALFGIGSRVLAALGYEKN